MTEGRGRVNKAGNEREHGGEVGGSAGVQPGCAEALAQLQELLDGELPVETAPQIVAHLESCPPCGFERVAFERIKAAVADCGNCVDDDTMSRLRAFATRVGEVVDGEDGGDSTPG